MWDDSYIGVGQPWEERIADAALRALVAVLLVSAKFNDSSYIRLTELPLLRKKGMETIWVSLDGELPSDPRERAVQGFRRQDDREPTDPEIDLLLRDAAGEVKRLFQESFGEAPPAAPA